MVIHGPGAAAPPGKTRTATGKAAALCGKFLKDKELINNAEQQLFWIVGRNPFGQSLIWGEGSNYPQLYTALPGEMVGAIPVGMESRGFIFGAPIAYKLGVGFVPAAPMNDATFGETPRRSR